MKSEELRYEADGLSMIGRFTWDETATSPRPGVLVFPEAFGLGEHAIGRGERLTKELGYAQASFDVKAYSDLSMVEEASKRLK